MKAAKVLYLRKAQSHFSEAMRLNGERDSIGHACAEIAAYIDAHQAAGVYMANDKSAIMYCAGVKIILKRVKYGAYEHFRRVVDHWRWQELPPPCAG